jgi:dipeptidyl aminopeptidase/acylaminoacyl peptidase
MNPGPSRRTVVARGIADGDKLAVMGWSYGGYMTAWIVSQTSRFRAARVGAGLSNNYSMYGTTDISGYISTFFEGYPGRTKDNLQLYLDRSGLYHADHVTTPLLIMHGAQDYRVPLGQATEYYRALRDRGKTVELVIYPRAGHGISEYFHRLDQLYREYRWIAKYTLGEEALTDLGDWGKEGP